MKFLIFFVVLTVFICISTQSAIDEAEKKSNNKMEALIFRRNPRNNNIRKRLIKPRGVPGGVGGGYPIGLNPGYYPGGNPNGYYPGGNGNGYYPGGSHDSSEECDGPYAYLFPNCYDDK